MLRQLEHTTWLATSAGQQPGGSRFSREQWDWALSVSSMLCCAELSLACHSMQPVCSPPATATTDCPVKHHSCRLRLRCMPVHLSCTAQMPLPALTCHAYMPQVVHSRTFGAPGPAGGVGVRMLVPLVDMLNHAGEWGRCRLLDFAAGLGMSQRRCGVVCAKLLAPLVAFEPLRGSLSLC